MNICLVCPGRRNSAGYGHEYGPACAMNNRSYAGLLLAPAEDFDLWQRPIFVLCLKYQQFS